MLIIEKKKKKKFCEVCKEKKESKEGSKRKSTRRLNAEHGDWELRGSKIYGHRRNDDIVEDIDCTAEDTMGIGKSGQILLKTWKVRK